MAMAMAPLFIKAKMTKGNYTKLLEEAKAQFRNDYINRYYKHDGTYFTLDICFMDDPTLKSEVTMIAKYLEPTNGTIGFIYTGGWSYSIAKIKLCNGKCEIESELKPMVIYDKDDEIIRAYKELYEKTKQNFFSSH